MVNHLGDIESDLSAIHGIHDMWSMEAGRFFRFAYRLPAYKGMMRVVAERQAMDEQKRTGGRDVVPVATGELGKIEGLPDMVDDGWLTVEKATD